MKAEREVLLRETGRKKTVSFAFLCFFFSFLFLEVMFYAKHDCFQLFF